MTSDLTAPGSETLTPVTPTTEAQNIAIGYVQLHRQTSNDSILFYFILTKIYYLYFSKSLRGVNVED